MCFLGIAIRSRISYIIGGASYLHDKFQGALFQATGKKDLSLTEMIFGANGSPVRNQQRRLLRWMEHSNTKCG